ncbi:MAG TPA: hypothetical protein PLH94_06500 [Fimbriimonadaceae bacterium]|nr:hypothetical protein [Fimbriimonadaceae bacterium]
MRSVLLGIVFGLVALSQAETVDVIVDLKGAQETQARVARVVGKSGRVLGREKNGLFRVELVGGKRAVAKLKKHASVASVTAVAPVLATNLLDIKEVTVLKRQIARYKAKYETYEELTRRIGESREEGTAREYPGLDYLEAYLYFVEERAFPFAKPDWKKWNDAGTHRDSMSAWQGAEPGPQGVSGTWQYLGPRNLDTPYRIYYGLPPLNGRINGVAYDPITPTTFYVVGAQGGVWKTTDNGATWSPLSDSWEVTAASSIAVHPTNPNILYVGTGDYPGSRPYCMGVMKSTDGGATWVNQGRAQLGSRAINKILIDPTNPNIVLVTQGRGVAGNGQVFRSTDGGATWSVAISTVASWSDLSVGVGSPRTIYAIGGDSAGGKVFRSQDSGATWTSITSPVTGSQSGMCIAASKVNANTVYLLAPSARKIYKSTNLGSTWSDVSAGFINGNSSLGANYNWSQGSYDFFMDTSTNGANDVVYVGLIDVVQSVNGGASWQSVGGPTYVGTSILHNDQHCIAIHPTNPNQALFGGDGGIFRFTYAPGTNTWSYNYLSANLGVTQFYRSAHHPTNPNIMLGGTQDNATPFANGNLATWDNVGGGDGGFCAIDATNPAIQYAEAQFLYLYRTTNSWVSSSGIAPSVGTDSVAFIAPFVLDPNNQSVLYAGTNYLWRWTSATGWTARLGSQLLSGSGNLRAIAVAPGDGQRIYTGASDGQVWMTSNGGTTWTQITTGSPGLPTRTITSISVNPSNKNDIVVTVSGTGTGHVYRCADTTAGTRVWSNRSGTGLTGLPDVPANSLARDITNPAAIWFVATDVGVFASGDFGGTWYNATAPLGLPNTQVNDVKTVPGTGKLMAATYGRGMWSLNLTNLQSVTGTVELRGYIPPAAPKTVTVQFFNPGTSTLAYSTTIAIGGGGPKGFALNVPLTGLYDVAMRGPTWLRQRITNVNLNPIGVSGLVFALKNADANGDNVVDSDDLDILVANFGGPGPGGDFDGVNGTDSDDFDILVQFFGQIGDN